MSDVVATLAKSLGLPPITFTNVDVNSQTPDDVLASMLVGFNFVITPPSDAPNTIQTAFARQNRAYIEVKRRERDGLKP